MAEAEEDTEEDVQPIKQVLTSSSQLHGENPAGDFPPPENHIKEPQSDDSFSNSFEKNTSLTVSFGTTDRTLSTSSNAPLVPPNIQVASLEEIGAQHKCFELAYDMMFGVRHSVSQTHSNKQKELIGSLQTSTEEPYLFTESKKYTFPKGGSSTTPPHTMDDFVFKDFCPQVFANLRKTFGIDATSYLYSLCGDFNLLEFQSNSKSNQFFFFSHDGQFLIKTMTYSESRFLRSILPRYYQHCLTHPNTFLCKFLGMHRIKPKGRGYVYFLIMENVTYSDLEVHLAYDIKGCTYGRRTKAVYDDDKLPVLKDVNWLEDGRSLSLNDKLSKKFVNQLKWDVKFLQGCNIMDYSLLVGIHYRAFADDFDVRQVSRSIATGSPIAGSPPMALTASDSTAFDLPTLTTPPGETSDPSPPPAKESFNLTEQESHTPPNRRISVIPSQVNFSVPELVETTSNRSRSLSSRVQKHPFKSVNGGFLGEDNDEIYFVGIIDILQQYNKRKAAESFMKGMIVDRKTISSVPPRDYGDRFLKFVRDHII